MNEIVLSDVKTEYQSLIEEVENLRLIIAALSAEKDDLELHVCREIQAEYDMKIGNLEYEIMNYNLEIERLKLVIDFMQSAINCTEFITEEEINKRAEEILGEYYEELKRKAEKIKEDMDYSERRSRNEESWVDGEYEDLESDYDDESDDGEEDFVKETPDEELKRLYRQIVKKLHPDMNPDITEEERRLLDDAIKAYADGDLDRIREIAEMLDTRDYTERFEDTEEGRAGLKRLLEHLKSRKEKLEAEINDIMNSFPYNAKDFLKDDEAVKARQDELKEKIESCKKVLEKLGEKIQELSEELEKAAYG